MARFGNRLQVGLAFAVEQATRGIRYSPLDEEQQGALRDLGSAILQDVTADCATRETAIAGIPGRLDSMP